MADWLKGIFGATLMAGGLVSAGGAEGDAFFERKIRPLLVEHCHECHGADARKLKAGLYLDSREGLLKGGESGPAVVPGRPEASLLIRAVGYADPDLKMPPRKRLGAAQIEDFKEWVRMGAPWPGSEESARTADGAFDLAKRKTEFWAWRPIRKHEPPAVLDAAWPRDDIDRFIAAKLDEKGWGPGPDADRRTLLRRLSYDLIGLPPTREEIRAFLTDDSDGALERVVDRLLGSRRFGERWARHWLDMVRYCETLGHEFDYEIQNAWRYRDYVIRALNADTPYDRFVMEHVAGDLLPDPRRHPVKGFNESVIGTAFYWFGQQKHSPVDIRQETADTIDNQIDVLTKTFMGMTVSCARCHDHKFDAISTRDYYAMFGVLGSSRYSQRAVDEVTSIVPVRDKLAGFLGEIGDRARASAKGALDRADEYASAALRLQREVENAGDDLIVFEDFEDELRGWITTGDAFSGPLTPSDIGSYQGSVNARGRGFINSHNFRRPTGEVTRSDRFTGSLNSPVFSIRHRFIHFLVGGGAHEERTCINLIVDNRIVASVTGRNNNRMEPARFDVEKWIGKEARLQAVDEVRTGWGNIGWDHIVFSDQEEVFAGDYRPKPDGRAVAAAARKAGLEPERLQKWANALPELRRLRAHEIDPRPRDHEVFADFAEGDAGWRREGAAWAEGGASVWAVRPEGTNGLRLRRPGWLDSATISRRLEGSLRSPTFTVSHDYVHLLVAGEESRVNAVVDNFTIIRNPIWGGLKRDLKNAEPHWVTMDLRMVRGHRAWLELLDQSVGDPGGRGRYGRDGWFAVRQVLFSDHARPPAASIAHPLASTVDRGDGGGIASAIRAAVGAWRVGKEPEAGQFALLDWLAEVGLLWNGNALADLQNHFREAERDLPEPTRVPGMSDGPGVDEHVFIRGSHRNRGDVAPRAFLAALNDGARYGAESSGRLQLARDLVDEANPLTARVIVNKVWHHLFGRGIVGTVDNFGVLGDRPTHPELLDRLAHDFRADGWSVKRLIRRLVLSRTYGLSSRLREDAAERLDPNNLLLHRANMKRLEGEAIRDAMLRVSGSLKDEMFGEPVPVHLTAFMEGRGRPGTSGPLDGDNRRSVYVAVRRNFLSPMMLAFDTPLPATTVGRRAVSNVPAQALIMMNDELVGELARRWAAQLAGSEASAMIRRMYESAFGRLPTADEQSAAVEFLRAQRELHGEGDADRAALADLAQVLFNVKEFLFLN